MQKKQLYAFLKLSGDYMCNASGISNDPEGPEPLNHAPITENENTKPGGTE